VHPETKSNFRQISQSYKLLTSEIKHALYFKTEASKNKEKILLPSSIILVVVLVQGSSTIITTRIMDYCKQGCVCFVPKIVVPIYWLANILVELFFAHKLTKINLKID
jgi:hypothetical protein